MNLNHSLQPYQNVKLNRRLVVAVPCCAWARVTRPSERQADRKMVQGMTLVELMVAIVVATLVLGVIATASMTAAHWFAALANYVDMDAKSRNALDQMTLKIRQAGALTEFTPTHLKFAVQGQTNSFLVYDWDVSTGSLTEARDSVTNILLTGCDQLSFSMYNASYAPTTNILQSEGLSVNWSCSRTILGRKTTEEMQQALIVLRNKPLPPL